MATQPPGLSTGVAVAARKLARDRMAAANIELRRKQAADTEDLAAFFTFDVALGKAGEKRDATIEAAEATYAQAQTRVRDGQGDTLRRMRERGSTEEELATLTGLELREVRALLKPPAATAAKPKPKPKTAPVVVADGSPAAGGDAAAVGDAGGDSTG